MGRERETHQNELMSFIVNFIDTYEYPPSMIDMEENLNRIKGYMLSQDLEDLQKDGCIEREPKISRGIRVTLTPWPFTYDEKYRNPAKEDSI